MQEERNRHAPVTLAGDTPIRAVGDHAVQARLPPSRGEFRRFDTGQRALAQGLAILAFDIHTDEPLGRGAVDHRRFMTPAVHVAVLNRRVGHQRVYVTQLLDDVRVGFPDHLAAEERQVIRVNAVALHRVQHIVKAHAVLAAGNKVIHTVRRSRVNDTGTAHLRLNVIRQIDRREAVVERVAEIDQVKVFTLCGSHYFTLETKAL